MISIKVRKLACSIGLITGVGFATGVPAQNQDFDKVEIKAAKVAGNVYMLQGMGGNIAALVGEEGIAIVDDQYAPLAEKISKALKMLNVTDKPVRFVINTHYHGDHTGGNASFSKTATIIAHENVRKRLSEGGETGNGGSIKMERKPAEKDALPLITFEKDVTVHLNNEEMQALHFNAGHTDTDSIVFFKKANVVHMGDNFVSGFPFIDIKGGGSLAGMIGILETVLKKMPDDAKVIPGHGPISSKNEVQAFLKMIKSCKEIVEKEFAKGKSLDEIKKMDPLKAYESYGKGFIKADQFIESIVYALSNKK